MITAWHDYYLISQETPVTNECNVVGLATYALHTVDIKAGALVLHFSAISRKYLPPALSVIRFALYVFGSVAIMPVFWYK